MGKKGEGGRWARPAKGGKKKKRKERREGEWAGLGSEEGKKEHGHLDLTKVHGNEKGFMKVEDVKKLIDDINKGNLHYGVLSLFWLGEPLLHPDFKEIMKYVNSHRKNYSGWLIHTNGLTLSKDVSKVLLKNVTEKDILHFSIDAATKETYDKIRRGGNFNKLKRNSARRNHQVGIKKSSCYAPEDYSRFM